MVQAAVHWNEGVWHVRTSIEYGSMRGERAVLVDTCSEAADFVALNVVLAVNPEVAEHIDVAEPVTRRADSEAMVSDHEQIAPHESQENELGPSYPSTAFEHAPRSNADEPRSRPWFVALDLGVVTGILPGLRLGPRLDMGYSIGGFRGSWGGAYFPPARHDLGANHLVRSSLAVGSISACYLFRLASDRVRLGPCAGGELGAILAGEASSKQKAALYGSAKVTGQLEWAFSRRLGAHLGAGVMVPIRPSHFVLTNQEIVFTPGMGFAGNLGFFWVL